jgi:hypothetical protein
VRSCAGENWDRERGCGGRIRLRRVWDSECKWRVADIEHVDGETRICTRHGTIDNGARLGMSSAYAMIQNEIS